MRTEDTIRDGGGQPLERLSVAQAARALGLTESGVRKRVSRGTLPHERDESGTVWVFVDPLQTVPGTPLDSQADEIRDTVLDALHDQVETLKDQVSYLQAEGERKDMIIMTLARRVPELELASNGSPEPRESPQTPSEKQGKVTRTPSTQTTETCRSPPGGGGSLGSNRTLGTMLPVLKI